MEGSGGLLGEGGSDVTEHEPFADADSESESSPGEVVRNAGPTPQPETFVVTLGDIGVTAHWVVTPNGTVPLAGTQWTLTDQTRTVRKIPTWAIVCAIAFALLCLIGLLFLLAKEDRTTGWLEVRVQGGTLDHTTQIPVTSDAQVRTLRQWFARAQTMAAAA
jgi:hypothetical protein